MKTWLNKFKISNALDSRKPLPLTIERAVAESKELRYFAERTAALDQDLKDSKPKPASPPALHDAIMCAVRAAETARAPAFNWQMFRSRLIPATALGCLLLLGIFSGSYLWQQPPKKSSPAASESFTVAMSAIETTSALAHKVTTAPVSALNSEMLRLNDDLANAKAFLLASLP